MSGAKTMSAKKICEQCGTDLPVTAPEGLCPACLMATAIGLGGADRPSSGAKSKTPENKTARRAIRRFGDYELMEEIARGGMGIVYRARQVSLNRTVAVKLLLFGQFASDEFVKRFRSEAETVASLQHPNIVAIHEIGEHEGQHYFSMDLVEGTNLADLVQGKPMPSRRAAICVQKIARAVHYAHQRGVLHRDLKPSNVLIGHDDQPYVTDFGLARRLRRDSELTPPGSALGSPNYMPPEQAFANRGGASPASDVYSLGAVLYYLLSGRPPFVADTIEGTLQQLLNTDPIEPRLLNPSVPRDLETICLKCLKKEPTQRYPSAEDLADELERFLGGLPVIARPTGRVEKLARWCRRNPALAGLSGAFLLAVSLGIAGVSWQWQRAEGESKRLRQSAYAQLMNNAFTAFGEGNRAQAILLLKSQNPKPGEADLRGFEWRHLWWLCTRGSYSTLPAKAQVLGAMSFSPNGQTLATYYWDDTLRLWDLKSATPFLTVTGTTSPGGFAGQDDAFVVGSHDGTIRWFRTTDGKMIRALPNLGEIIAVSADAKSAVSLENRGNLKVLNVADGQVRCQVPGRISRRSDYGWGSEVAISADGTMLAVIERDPDSERLDTGISVWNVESGTRSAFLKEERQIRCLQFSPDSSTLATGDGNGWVRLWDCQTSRQRAFWQAHNDPIFCLAFGPDSRTFATGSSDESIRLWDVHTGHPEPEASLEAVGEVRSLAFSPDGRQLISGGRDNEVRLWDLKEALPCDSLDGLLAPSDWDNFAFSSDSRSIAAGDTNDSVKVWDTATLKMELELAHAGYALVFSADGKNLLTCTKEGMARWWEVGTGMPRPGPRDQLNFQDVTCADFFPGRHAAALGSRDGCVRVMDLDSGTDLARWQAHNDAVLSIRFDSTGEKLVTGGRDRALIVWDVKTRKPLESKPESHRGAISAVTCSRDGELIASGCRADMVRVWNASNLENPLGAMPFHKSAIQSLDFSHDGRTLASGSADNTVKFLNVAFRQEMATFNENSPVRLVRFSPDNDTLAILTEDGHLKLLRAISHKEALSVR